MIQFQDRAASDDAAKAAANYAAKTAPQSEPSIAERMASLFCWNLASSQGTTTDKDLWMEGFTKVEIAEHLPEAIKLARTRTNS